MADIYLSVDGNRATSIDAWVPFYGLPVADVVLSADAPLPATPVVVKIGNLSMRMTVGTRPDGTKMQRAFAGSTQARLVGGYGGWAKKVKLNPYSRAAGVLVSTVLRDVATAAGEVAVLAANLNTSLGLRWCPEPNAPAGRILSQLAGSLWWVDPAGVTQISTLRASNAITTPASVESYDGGRGMLVVATEDPASWLPGATYKGPTIPAGVSVKDSRIFARTDGRLRVEALVS